MRLYGTGSKKFENSSVAAIFRVFLPSVIVREGKLQSIIARSNVLARSYDVIHEGGFPLLPYDVRSCFLVLCVHAARKS